MRARWLLISVGVLGFAIGACGGSGADGAVSASSITWAPTTVPINPQVTVAFTAMCHAVYDEEATDTPGTLPTSSLLDVPPYRQLFQAEQVWNDNPGAPFNLGVMQTACEKFHLWSSSQVGSPPSS